MSPAASTSANTGWRPSPSICSPRLDAGRQFWTSWAESTEGWIMSTMMMPIASMVGSALTAAWTAYFWLVRVKRERPDLRVYLADQEMFLAHSTGDQRHVGIKLGLIVANYSALPNALL